MKNSKMVIDTANAILGMRDRNPEREIKEQIAQLEKIDFSKFGEGGNLKKTSELQKKIESFKKVLSTTSDPEVRKFLEEGKKEAEEELKVIKGGELATVKKVSEALSKMFDKYAHPEIEEKLLEDLREMMEDKEVQENIENAADTVVAATTLIKSWGDDPKNHDKKEDMKKKLEDAKGWLEANELANKVLGSSAEDDDETSKYFNVMASLIASSKEILAVGIIDRSSWRKHFIGYVLEEMDDSEIDDLVDFLCSKWAVIFRIPSNLFKAVIEFVEDQDDLVKALEKADSIKTELVGREPVSPKDNDEYVAILKSYMEAFESGNAKELKKLRKSRFIFDEEDVLEKYF